MASSPITSWQIEGEKVEAVAGFLYSGSKITVDSDCSHMRRRVLVGRKAMTNLDSVLKKNKDITADKGLYSQAYDLFSIHIQL